MTKNKTVLILHGYLSSAQDFFIPKLASELSKDANIVCPELPDANNPKRSDWVATVLKALNGLVPDMIIGHSLGGTLALILLEEELLTTKALFTLGSSHCPKDEEVLNSMLVPPISVMKLSKLPTNYFVVQSYDDPYTHPECAALLIKQIGAMGLFFHNQGHFLEKDLPNKLVEIMRRELLASD
jgi:predicted alpha/beta hydrolase family esterase